MDTFFPTSTPAMQEEIAAHNDRDDLIIQIDTLSNENERLQMNFNSVRRLNEELNLKINAVRGHILDLYSMNGDIDEEIKEIAALLDIELTKRVRGTMTIEVEYDFDAPLGFDNDDLELSYTIDCDSHEVDNFDWNEVSADWSSEDED